MARKIMSAIAVATLATTPVFAITPMRGPPEYSAYGPLQICAADYKFEVGENEAVHIVGSVTRLLRDDYLIASVPVVLSSEKLGKSISIPIMLDGGRKAYRFTEATPDPNREVFFASRALGPDDIRYAVSVPGDDVRFVIIGSTAFTGTVSDKNILARMFSTKAKSPDCIRPEVARSVYLDADASEEMKRIYAKLNYQARIYPPKPDMGHSFQCLKGIGFAVKAGEAVWRPWLSLGEANESMVDSNGVMIKLKAREEPLYRADQNDGKEHPLGLLHQSRIIYYPSRGIGPPYAAEGVREDGSWSVELGPYPRQKIEISFPASDKTPIGFQFLERLQFVEKGDPRCT